jgi:hypothetical protein
VCCMRGALRCRSGSLPVAIFLGDSTIGYTTTAVLQSARQTPEGKSMIRPIRFLSLLVLVLSVGCRAMNSQIAANLHLDKPTANPSPSEVTVVYQPVTGAFFQPISPVTDRSNYVNTFSNVAMGAILVNTNDNTQIVGNGGGIGVGGTSISYGPSNTSTLTPCTTNLDTMNDLHDGGLYTSNTCLIQVSAASNVTIQIQPGGNAESGGTVSETYSGGILFISTSP